MVEEASFQEEVDQCVKRVPDEEEAVAARCRRREGLERGRVGHGQDHNSRREGHEGGLVEQVGRETGVVGCCVTGHRDRYGGDGTIYGIGIFDGVEAVLELRLGRSSRIDAVLVGTIATRWNSGRRRLASLLRVLRNSRQGPCARISMQLQALQTNISNPLVQNILNQTATNVQNS